MISTESLDGGMFSTAVTQSSPAFFTFLYSTRNDWMGKPRLPRGIQVTYADVSVAVETVGLSGASGAAEEEERSQTEDINFKTTFCNYDSEGKTSYIPALTESSSFRDGKEKEIGEVSMLVKRRMKLEVQGQYHVTVILVV